METNQLTKREQRIHSCLSYIPKSVLYQLVPLANKLRVMNLKKLKTPLNLIFYVTNRCNAKCKHCFYWKQLNISLGEPELTLKEIKKIVKSLKNRLELVSLTGGEPFLRKDLYSICETFYTINDTERVNIITNGFFVDKTYNLARKLLKKFPQKKLSVCVSIDGLEKTHDAIRGINGLFKIATKTIQKLIQLQSKYNGLLVFVITTVSKENYDDVVKLNKIVSELGAIHKISLLRDKNTTMNIDPNILNDFDVSSVERPCYEKLEKLYQFMKQKDASISDKVETLKIRYSIDMLKKRKEKVKCYAGITDGVLFSNGDMSICEPILPFANIRYSDFDFARAWNSDCANIRRNQAKGCFCLQSCNLLNAMKYDSKTILRIICNLKTN